MRHEPIIKWTGSKGYCADFVLSYLGETSACITDPFFGGGSFAYYAVTNGHIEEYYGSDICIPLVNLWVALKTDPSTVLREYTQLRSKLLIKGVDYYNEVRAEFNSNKSPFLFFFLTRTSFNGLIRFNSDGEFNAPFHHNRNGIEPDKLKKIIEKWKPVLERITIRYSDYEDVDIKGKLILDPPYGPGTYDKFDTDRFMRWLEHKEHWILTYPKDPDVKFDEKIPIPKSMSSFKKLKNQGGHAMQREFLYIKRQSDVSTTPLKDMMQSNFIYHCPNYRKDESRYKRNWMQGVDADSSRVTYYGYIMRLPDGLSRFRKSCEQNPGRPRDKGSEEICRVSVRRWS